MHLELAHDRVRHPQQFQSRTARRAAAASASSSSSSSQIPSIDHLDRLPESLLLLIFNKIGDVKALGRCCAVSKRFNSICMQVENVVVKVDCVISSNETGLGCKGKGIFGHIVRLMIGSIVKPLQALQHLIGPRKDLLGQVSPHSPGEVLKNFKEIQHLRIELPGGELGVEDGVLLKWKAEFGSTLERCVILGASSLSNKGLKADSRKFPDPNPNSTPQVRFNEENDDDDDPDDDGCIPESFYTNGGLKLRVVWTISSLIAASARHYLLQQIICDHPTLQSLVLTDADGQGTLCMGREQLREFRLKPLATSASSNRTQIPALNMKLRYAQSLALPGGLVMQGGTLINIRPSDPQGAAKKESEDSIPAAFDQEPYMTAVRALLKRRTYLLEMNSF